MLTILSALLGFLSSSFPSIISYFTAKNDALHEQAIMALQIELAKLDVEQKLEAIDTNSYVEQMKALYSQPQSKIAWIEGLNGIVRPLIALSLFALYMATKLPIVYLQLEDGGAIYNLFDDDDYIILSSVIAYYFGSLHHSRMMGK